MRPGREPLECWRPPVEGSLPTVLHTWTRPGTDDFLGARCQGWAEPSPVPTHLDPDGWLVRILRTRAKKLRARNPTEQLTLHPRAGPRKRTLPVRGRVGR